jgi:hypothetical protein
MGCSGGKPGGGKCWAAVFQAKKERIARNRQQKDAQPPRRRAPVYALIEFEVGLWLGEGIARKSFFIEKDGPGVVPLPLRGPSCRGDPRRLGRLADVAKNPLHGAASVMNTRVRMSAPQRGQVRGNAS